MVDTADAPAGTGGTPPSPRPARYPPGGPLPLWAGALAAVAAGAALLAAFPPYGLWWLAPVGVALLAAATHRRRLRGGAGLGLLAGVVFFAPLLRWTNLNTGDLPWLLLSGLESVYLGLLGVAAAATSPLVERWRWSWPVLTGTLWVAQEGLRDRTPFGGFPWGRLAFSQGDAPTLRLAALGGAPLVTFAVAACGGLLVAALWSPGRGMPWSPRRTAPAAAGGTGLAVTRSAGAGRSGPTGAGARLGLLAAAVAVAAVGLLVPVGGRPAGPAGSATVAIVQGNVPRMGLDFNAQRMAVLGNHVDATIALAADVAAGRQPQPALVVWPENASDIDPLVNPDAAVRISAAAAAIKAPILVGAVLEGPGPGHVRNAGLIWQPGTGPDLSQVYVKRHPVPFAEYIPLRSLARRVSKEVDLVRADFVAGTRVGVLRPGGPVLGDVICFEVAYDGLVRDTVTGGAQLLVVQTNNATFDADEARQQLAMVRLRAVEHGRESLMASTVGVSGFVSPDGRVHGATGFNTPAVVIRQVPLGDGRTIATRLGVWPEVALIGLAAAALVAAVPVRRRRLRPAAATGDAGEPADAEER